MDRRTLIALVLSAGVVMLFQVLYFAPAEREAARRRQEKALLAKSEADSLQALSGEGPDTLGARAIAPVEPDVRLEAGPGEAVQPALPGASALFAVASLLGAPAREVAVETDLYEAVFSSRGGVIKSMRLKQFEGLEGEVVDLVRDREKGELGLLIRSEKGQVDLNSVSFWVRDSVDTETGRIRKLSFFAADSFGASISKTFTFAEDSYAIGLDLELRGVSSQEEKLEYFLGWTGGLSLTETNQKEEIRSMATVSLLGTEMIRDDLGSFKKTQMKEHTGNVKWTGVRSRYFIAALLPPEGTVSRVVTFGDPEKNLSGAQLPVPISLGGVTQTTYTIYLGPIDLWKLKDLGVGLERVVNMGWSWIRPVSQLVLWFLVVCHSAIPNYGLVVIVLSALTKVLFYPLTKSSMKSMREMQKLQPEIQKLKEKLKKDPQRLNKAVMALYKEHKINPLGGCFPLLLQMPVFIALYNVLMHSIEMRKANFVWWMNDLSSPDTAAVVGGFSIHLLPLLMAASMFWQQKMTPTDPRQAAMMYFMPILMLVFFYSLPSGLVLYWTANNVMTIIQQYITQRGEKAKAAPQAGLDEKHKRAIKP